jgi:hypothetical protein
VRASGRSSEAYFAVTTAEVDNSVARAHTKMLELCQRDANVATNSEKGRKAPCTKGEGEKHQYHPHLEKSNDDIIIAGHKRRNEGLLPTIAEQRHPSRGQ